LTDERKYLVKPLEQEDRAAFVCGQEALDNYFWQLASRDIKNKLCVVFIVIPEDDPKTIVGFFTLSSQQISCDQLPEEFRKKTGRYKAVGATLLGRMAVATAFQKQKLGRFLLFSALHQAWKATKYVSSFAVVVDAKSEQVVPFYEKYGFRRLEGNRLMMAMRTIEELMAPHTLTSRTPSTSKTT
jgi:predicted N-acetyltransferase YhbS